MMQKRFLKRPDGLTRILLVSLTALFLLSFARPAAALPPQSKARSTNAAVTIPILGYHYVSPNTPPINLLDPGYSSYFVTPDQFAAQLDVLKAYGYTTIGLEDLLQYRADPLNTILPAKPVIITFDDGDQGNYLYAYPALKARSMRATFFVPTSYIQNTDNLRCVASNWDGMPSCQMIWPELLEMHQNGFEIGSHTQNHVNLSTLYVSDPISAAAEITQSKADIEAHLGAGSARFFAYPYGQGAGTQAIMDLVAGTPAGSTYLAAVAYDNGGTIGDVLANPISDNPYAMPRRSVYREHTNVLDVNNPYNFFITRVDPAFPLPNLGYSATSITDAEGRPRTQFFAGEAVTFNFSVGNYGQAADVKARLKFNNAQGISYDSRMASPVADQTALAMPSSHVFAYPWTIPASSQSLGTYTYQLFFSDPTGLLNYFSYAPTVSSTPEFEVVPKPVTVSANLARLPVLPGEIQPLTFHVSFAQPVSHFYLTVSHTDHLQVVDATGDSGTWTSYVKGSTLKDVSGNPIPTTYAVYELSNLNQINAGSQSFVLQIKGLAGVGAQDWVKYRLSMNTVQINPTGGYFLTEPLRGSPLDQQGYSAYQITGTDPLRLFMPSVQR